MEIKRIDSISDFNSFIGVETLHPLVSVVDFSTIDTAHHLGFEYPQYFSRQFKKHTGMTPNEYRTIN